jgi:hypothetical protein
MRAVFRWYFPVAATLSLSTVACTGSGDDCAVVSVASVAADATTGDAFVGADADAGTAESDGAAVEPYKPTSSAALVRVANWGPGAPGVDFCLAPHGTTSFQGPLLSSVAAAINDAGVLDAGAPSISFPLASTYVPVAPGQYDARLVAGGASDCSTKIVPDTPLPAVSGGQAMTVALLANPVADAGPLGVVGLLDDITPPGAIGIRAIHGATSLANIDVGTIASAMNASFARLFITIPFGASSSSAANAAVAKVDPNGYAPSPALASVGIAVRPSGAPNNAAFAKGVSIAAGAVVTLIVVDTAAPSATSPAASLIECVDNAGTPSLAGDCQIISQ